MPKPSPNSAHTQADLTGLLIVAAKSGQIDLCVALIQKGADLSAALLTTATAGYEVAVHTLLWIGADVNATESKSGMTALHLAATGGAPAVVALIKAGAKINARERLDLATPLHIAADADCASAINDLVNAGADLTAKDKAGFTPLMIAKSRGNRRAFRLLTQATKRKQPFRALPPQRRTGWPRWPRRPLRASETK